MHACVFLWECVGLYVWVCVRGLRGYIFYSSEAVFGPGLCETVSLCVFVGVTRMESKMYDKAEMLTKWSTVEKQQSRGRNLLSREINH